MNYQAIELLARQRINALASEAAESRLANEREASATSPSISIRKVLERRLHPVAERTAALRRGRPSFRRPSVVCATS